MSDGHLRLIPADRSWQPSPSQAQALAAYAEGLFDRVDEVAPRFYDEVTVIDAGVNTSSVTCPNCHGELVDWYFDQIGDYLDQPSGWPVEVPCCGRTMPFASLTADWPIGFARFEVDLRNPVRDRYELDEAELAEAGRWLGHPVTQIRAHY